MKSIIRYFIIITLTLLFFSENYSQTITWQKFYRTKGIPDVTVITDIVQTNDDGYIFVGRSARDSMPGSVMFAYGIDKFGDSLWYKEYFYYPGGQIKKLDDGNFMIINADCDLIKINPFGDTIWVKRRPDTTEVLLSARLTYENNIFYICGFTAAHKPYLLILDSLGNDVFFREFNYIWGVAAAPLVDENNIYISGYVILPENYFLIKTDLYGNILWTKDYNQKIINFFGISLLNSPYEESIIFGGSSNFNNNTIPSLMKRDTAGNILWQYNYNNEYYNFFPIVQILKDLKKNIISLALSTHPSGNSAWLINFDFNGKELWRKNYNLAQEHFDARCFNITNDSGYIIGGLALGGVHQNTPIYIIKTDPLGNVVSVNNGFEFLPNQIKLYQNYPNPFNPYTTISYYIPAAGNVKLAIYDMLGREVAVLINERKFAGKHEVVWDASDLSSGAYFYTIESGDFTAFKKLILVK